MGMGKKCWVSDKVHTKRKDKKTFWDGFKTVERKKDKTERQKDRKTERQKDLLRRFQDCGTS